MRPGAKILLVDDDADVLSVVAATLIGAGFNVRMAGNGNTALGLFNQQPADVVISDIKMPGLDGFGLLRAVKAVQRTTKVVLVSGYDEFVELAKLTREVDGILAKPVDPETLLELVRKLK